MRDKSIYPSFSKIRVWRAVSKIIVELSKHEECKCTAPLTNGWELVGAKHNARNSIATVEYEFYLQHPDECIGKSMGFMRPTHETIWELINFISSGKA